MLSCDIHTTLGSRYMDEVVFPYSFYEYVSSQGVRLDKEWSYGETKFKVQQLFAQYLKWGGYPELLLFKNKRRWLNDVYEKIVLSDIILRNKIRNEMALRLTFKRIAESITKPISYNRICNLVKSVRLSTSTTSIIQYVEYAKDAFVFFDIENYASKFVDKATIKKYYYIDNGLLSVFLSDTTSPFLENVCAIHLYKMYRDKLYFYNKKIEVDFVIPQSRLAVQVCSTLSDPTTCEREVEALVRLAKVVEIDRMLIVTLDEEYTIPTAQGKTIEVVPVWKWLLEPYQ